MERHIHDPVLLPQDRNYTLHFFLPLGDASECSEKMVAPGEKSFCALEYHTSKSVVTVRRAFRAKYAKDPPTDKTIHAWYQQLQQ